MADIARRGNEKLPEAAHKSWSRLKLASIPADQLILGPDPMIGR
jgi:hypothetical protein